MAKLSTKARNALPAKDFAGPNRSYPIPDKAHAVAAERLAGRGVRAGNISAGQADKIKAEAKAKLGDKSPPAKKSAPPKAAAPPQNGKADGFMPDTHMGVEHNSKHR